VSGADGVLDGWNADLSHPPRVLNGPPGSGKTGVLLMRYRQLLQGGEFPTGVVVWVSNQQAVQHWQQVIRDWNHRGVNATVMTFRSWVRQELMQNWALVESSGVLPGKPPQAMPFFIGLMAAQQILADCCAEIDPQHDVLSESFTAPAMRRVQVLDAYARVIEHGLPYDTVLPRLNACHDAGPHSQAFHAYIAAAIAAYRARCMTYRVLDHTLQLELFTLALLNHRGYLQRLAAQTQHVLVDDFEECCPVALRVIDHVSKKARSVLVACNPLGGLREYLGGDPVGAQALSQGFEERHLMVSEAALPAASLADYLYAQAVNEAVDLVNMNGKRSILSLHPSCVLRVQMFDGLIARVRALVAQGVPSQQIVVIAPMVDPLLLWHLREGLAQDGLPLRVLTGTNRVVDHRPVRVLTTLVRLARPQWQMPPPEADVTEMLETLLNLHPLESPHVQRGVYQDGNLNVADTVNWPRLLENRRASYDGLYGWVKQMRESEAPLDVLLEQAFAQVYAPRCLLGLAPDGVKGEAGSLKSADVAMDVLQIDQLIQNARTHRHLMAALGEGSAGDPKRFLRSIYAGELAERPLIPRGSLPAAVTVYTAAKYAEEGAPVAHQLWVDVASPLWWKSDIREFINPRVLSRNWDEGMYTEDHDQRDQSLKLGRTLRAMVSKCRVGLDVFASDHGSDGAELSGELLGWFAEFAHATRAIANGTATEVSL
jgi:hypothetical protein